MIVELLQLDSNHPHLSTGQRYVVIGIEADYLRVLNDWGEPCLYPPELFSVVDAKEPELWISETGDEGERYAYPPEFFRPGFFEDLFDRKEEAMKIFWQTINRGLTAA
jgi:hypothetical protein